MNITALASALKQYHVVLEPDKNLTDWWAGAPSAALGPDGAFYVAARMREADSPRGRRGYEIRILKSTDGIHFAPINRLTREAAGVEGFERPALAFDPASGKFRLYGCATNGHGWWIIRFDDVADPADFMAKSARPVLAHTPNTDRYPAFTGYKDPVVFFTEVRWHMMVIGCDFVERIHHFVSDDGDVWTPAAPLPIMENTGWHNFFTRPASVLPMPVGYLLIYEGSHFTWTDPAYNIATGLAFSPDLQRFHDLTPDAPLLKSDTPGDYHTWRYSHWLRAGDRVFVYFEASRPNNTNELRVSVLEGL